MDTSMPQRYLDDFTPGEVFKSVPQILSDKHFAAFAANRGQPEPNTVRTIRRVLIRQRGFAWTLEFDGDGFLYKMVRMLVAAMVQCAQGKMSINDLAIR